MSMPPRLPRDRTPAIRPATGDEATARLRVCVASADGWRVAIPGDMIVERFTVAPSAIRRHPGIAGGPRSLVDGERHWPLIELHHLLTIPEWPRPDAAGRYLVLVLAAQAGEIALIVDTLGEEIAASANGAIGAASGPAGVRYVRLDDGEVLPALGRDQLG